jgi:Tol biopolymer transport system component
MVVLVLAGYWGWDLVRSRDSRLPQLKVVSLTSYPGNERLPSFSPDGSEIVFAWDGGTGGPFQIYRKLIEPEGQPFRLTTDPAGGNCPAWSPDGKSIAFVRVQAETRKRNIVIISPLGGPERKLTECAGPLPALPPLAWTPDSRFLAIVDFATGDLATALFLVSIETGERRQLTFPLGSKGRGDSGVSLSPDGRTLAFVRSTGHYMWDLFALSLSQDFKPQGEPRRVTFDNGAFSGPKWASGGKDLVFAANRRGAARQLWRINVSGREPAQLIPVPYEAGISLTISPRGDRLIYETGGHTDDDIWKLDLAQKEGQPAIATRLIASSYLDSNPLFSPDGRKVVFQSGRTGTSQIWVADSNGGNPLQLTRFEANSGAPSWSPDGRRIVFDTTVNGNRDIFIVEADGGKPMPFITDPSEELLPRWSRDGKWIYFSSLRSGEYQLWKTPVSGGEAIQVTRKGGMAAEESEDGAYLYYTKREWNTSLWRMPTAGGEEVQIAESVPDWGSFSVGRDGVYFVSRTPPPEPGSAPEFEVRFHRFADGATQTVAGLEEYWTGLSVSPDGRTLLFSRTARRIGIDLMLIENFR